MVVDMRPSEEYRAEHIVGAISVLVGDPSRRVSELPENTEIVAYRRGPYSGLAPPALDLLRANGLRARRLVDGLPEWRRPGCRWRPGRPEASVSEGQRR